MQLSWECCPLPTSQEDRNLHRSRNNTELLQCITPSSGTSKNTARFGSAFSSTCLLMERGLQSDVMLYCLAGTVLTLLLLNG
ncbi:hypothetical protein FKM82_008426 [Ascaphus truei]